MGVIRYKIWHDLWANKARTLQVVLIIGMGAFAIGMIIGTRNLVIGGMEQIWRASSPAMIALWAGPRVDDDTLLALGRIDGVEAIEGYATTTVEWRRNPQEEWLAGDMIARRDYENQRYAVIDRTAGAWPGEDTLAMGQGVDAVFGVGLGDVIELRVDGRIHRLPVTGAVSNPVSQPPSFGGSAQFFVTRDTFEALFGTRNYDRILAAAPSYDRDRLTAIANEMQDRLERQGIDSGGFMPPLGERVTDPNKHFFQDTVDGIFLVLTIMAVLALLLGLFLVYNTINAVIAQQVDQIGVMKAIGASSWQILSIYLLYVLTFGVLALLFAVPLGALGGWGLNVFLLNSFNAEPGAFAVSWEALGAQVVIALLAPLLVALVPVFSGARISVREAISTYGLSSKPGLLDRLITRLKHVSRLLLLTVSNTFRHKGRVALTQITLVLSGLIFMMVMGVRDSTQYTFSDVLFSILNSNINLAFERPERINYVEELTREHPLVADAEMWAFANAAARPFSQPESDDDPTTLLFGVPPDTELYGHQMRAGRWLLPEDGYAVVLNQNLADDLGVGVGDRLIFNQGVRGDSEWEVVGLLFDPLIANSAHVPRDVLLREQGSVGRTNSIWIRTVQGGAAYEQTAVRELRQFYEDQHLALSPGGILAGQDTSSEVTAVFNTQFRSIITLLATMAVVIGIVGSISLSGVLSLTVIERGREIGVMRAIGASSWDIARLFIGEGLILGWLSWLIALPLSLPAGRLMTEALSSALGTEIIYFYTPQGAVYWLAIISVLAILASWLPARRAMNISVRESLAYQ